MGLMGNSIGFVRFTVEGELTCSPEELLDRARQHCFTDIDDDFAELSSGWVSVGNLLDNGLVAGPVLVGDCLTLSLRIDQRKVSTAVLKKMCMKEEARIRAERQVPKLSRDQRLEIKENMRLQLVKKAVPTPAIYDLVWNLADGVVYFFSTSAKVAAFLEDIFKACFGLYLQQQIPYTTGGRRLDVVGFERLGEMQPAMMA